MSILFIKDNYKNKENILLNKIKDTIDFKQEETPEMTKMKNKLKKDMIEIKKLKKENLKLVKNIKAMKNIFRKRGV